MGLKQFKIKFGGEYSPASYERSMPRSEFRELLDGAFAGDSTDDMKQAIRNLGHNAEHVAWGAWFVEHPDGLKCACPVASVADPSPDYYRTFNGDDDAKQACGNGPGRWDTTMRRLTGEETGILHITD